jgi:hypothetical protein
MSQRKPKVGLAGHDKTAQMPKHELERSSPEKGYSTQCFGSGMIYSGSSGRSNFQDIPETEADPSQKVLNKDNLAK